MENNVTLVILLALATAPQPLNAQAAATSKAPAPTTQSAKPAPYQPEFVIPKPQDPSGQTISPPVATTPLNPNSYRIG